MITVYFCRYLQLSHLLFDPLQIDYSYLGIMSIWALRRIDRNGVYLAVLAPPLVIGQL